MPTNLPVPTVIGAEGLDAYSVQANFEALARQTANISSSGVVGLPPGLIFPYAGGTAPTGYLFCQGQSLNTTQYSALFAAIGYAYGGSGANFNVPDLQGRAPVGKGTHVDVDALNDSDGLALASRTPKHTHVVPKHKHSVTVSGTTSTTDTNHEHASGNGGLFLSTGGGTSANVSTGGGGYVLQYTTSVNRNASHNHTVTSTGTAGTTTDPSGDADLTSGSGQTAYVVVNYIIKT